jgi:hypothetical protein
MNDKALVFEAKENTTRGFNFLAIVLIFALIGLTFCSFVMGYLASYNLNYVHDDNTVQKPRENIMREDTSIIGKCINNSTKAAGLQQISKDSFHEFSILCTSLIFNESALDDYRIRRMKFEQQYYAEGVTLWMVVAITISGVMLAAVQLMASYKLALIGKEAFAQDSSMALEQGKVSLKSSITGLFILTISFAFFLVYVLYIYTITEANLEKPKVAESQVMPVSGVTAMSDGKNFSPGLLLQSGGLGAPPNVTVKQDPTFAGGTDSKENRSFMTDGMVDPMKPPGK